MYFYGEKSLSGYIPETVKFRLGVEGVQCHGMTLI